MPHDWLRHCRNLLPTVPSHAAAQALEVFFPSSSTSTSFPAFSVSEACGRAGAQRCSRQRRSRWTESRVRNGRQRSAPHSTSLLTSLSLSRGLHHNPTNTVRTIKSCVLTVYIDAISFACNSESFDVKGSREIDCLKKLDTFLFLQ